MLNNDKGFTIIEALVGITIISFIVLLTLPLQHLIKVEREVLHERRSISYYLHDELLKEANKKDEQLSQPFSSRINNTRIFISFTNENLYIRGCVRWENAKKNEENKCLYTIAKQ